MNAPTSADPRAAGWRPPATLRRLVARLPIRPPSFVLALALDRLLLPRLPADAATLLADRVVEIEVRDFGIRCRLRLGPSGFRAVPDGGPGGGERGGVGAGVGGARGGDARRAGGAERAVRGARGVTHRRTPSFFIRLCSVVGLTPSSRAAPSAP